MSGRNLIRKLERLLEDEREADDLVERYMHLSDEELRDLLERTAEALRTGAPIPRLRPVEDDGEAREEGAGLGSRYRDLSDEDLLARLAECHRRLGGNVPSLPGTDRPRPTPPAPDPEPEVGPDPVVGDAEQDAEDAPVTEPDPGEPEPVAEAEQDAEDAPVAEPDGDEAPARPMSAFERRQWEILRREMARVERRADAHRRALERAERWSPPGWTGSVTVSPSASEGLRRALED